MNVVIPVRRAVWLAALCCLCFEATLLMGQAPAPAPAPSTNPETREGMPPALQQELDELEEWTRLNQNDARRDAVLFWLFKGTAVALSAAAGVLAFAKRPIPKAIAGPVASVLVLLDGFFAPGMLRGIHQLAVSDLRELQQRMVSDWRIGSLKSERPEPLAAKILEVAQVEKQRISAYLKKAESGIDKTPE